MPVLTYDAKAVTLTIGGLAISGFSDGDKITVERDGEFWTKKKGTDGETVRSRNNASGGGKVTINLFYGAASNLILEAAKTLDLVTGHGTTNLSIVDLNGGMIITAPTAWVMSEPAPTFGPESGESSWVLDCADLFQTNGALIVD